MTRSRKPPVWPAFDAPLLGDMAAALRKRSKALRAWGELSCEQEWSETGEGAFERLNIDLEGAVSLRLSVWADGVLWLRACQAGPRRTGGWAFQEQFHASVGSLSASEIVEKLEESRAMCSPPRAEDCREQLRRMWGVAPEGERGA